MKLKFIIEGKKTHDIGYRVFLVTKAVSLGVNNFYVSNTFIDDVQTVSAMIEADDKIIEEFKAFIRSTKPKDAEVENIKIEEYKRRIPPIELYMQFYQIEQYDKVIQRYSNSITIAGETEQ